MKPDHPGLPLRDLRRRCTARGMNLVGAIDADAFDATQPCGRRARERMVTCDTIVLLGSGGRVGWENVTRENGGPIGAARPSYHPIDGWSERVAVEVADALRSGGRAVTVVRPDDRHPMNFRQLGEQVGFGTISPVIGHLLHPEFGPWVSLRAALLVAGSPFGPASPAPLADFEPCSGCARPCTPACPAGVYADSGKPDLLGCARFRVDGGCAGGCEVLRACPVGAEHRYGPEEEAFRHAYSLFYARRWLGAGPWRLVPRRLRQR